MSQNFFGLVFITALSVSAHAEIQYRCENGELERNIRVVYDAQTEKVPCEVRYDKGEGEKMLWYAETEVGYCEYQAKQFVAKHTNWGWDCQLIEDTEVIDTSEMGLTGQADETDVLNTQHTPSE